MCLTYRGRCYRFCCYTNIDGMLCEACRVRLEACNVNIVCLSLKIKGLPSVFGHFLLGTAFEDSEYTNESNWICIRFSELIYIHAWPRGCGYEVSVAPRFPCKIMSVWENAAVQLTPAKHYVHVCLLLMISYRPTSITTSVFWNYAIHVFYDQY